MVRAVAVLIVLPLGWEEGESALSPRADSFVRVGSRRIGPTPFRLIALAPHRRGKPSSTRRLELHESPLVWFIGLLHLHPLGA